MKLQFNLHHHINKCKICKSVTSLTPTPNTYTLCTCLLVQNRGLRQWAIKKASYCSPAGDFLILHLPILSKSFNKTVFQKGSFCYSNLTGKQTNTIKQDGYWWKDSSPMIRTKVPEPSLKGHMFNTPSRHQTFNYLWK